MSITVITKTKIKPERLDDALEQWKILIGKMRESEPGLLKWDILKSSHEPSTYYCVEEFVDEDAIELHIRQDYVKDSVDAFKDIVDGDVAENPEELKTWSDVTEAIVNLDTA